MGTTVSQFREPLALGQDGPMIFISAAEHSADLHGASLIRAIRSICPTAHFIGNTGPRMRQEGCWSTFDMTSKSAMLGGVFGAAGHALRMLNISERYLKRYPFDIVILIDSPTLHLPLAKKAKKLDLPTFYYIAPQIWAWGKSRIHRVRHRVDKIACILPFEEQYFRERDVDATFVGHPLFETLMKRPCDAGLVENLKSQGSPVVALLPGSRKHVVEEVFPGQLEVATTIAREYPDAVFPLAIASPEVKPIITKLLDESGLNAEIYFGKNAEILTAADLALVASGTATLETAFYNTPMVVMYRSSRVGYHLIGRWIISTKFFSLVNILAGREVVPEFMPYYTSTEPIAERALNLLADRNLREEVRTQLAETIAPLLKPGAADNAANLITRMIKQSSVCT